MHTINLCRPLQSASNNCCNQFGAFWPRLQLQLPTHLLILSLSGRCNNSSSLLLGDSRKLTKCIPSRLELQMHFLSTVRWLRLAPLHTLHSPLCTYSTHSSYSLYTLQKHSTSNCSLHRAVSAIKCEAFTCTFHSQFSFSNLENRKSLLTISFNAHRQWAWPCLVNLYVCNASDNTSGSQTETETVGQTQKQFTRLSHSEKQNQPELELLFH